MFAKKDSDPIDMKRVSSPDISVVPAGSEINLTNKVLALGG